MPTESDKIVVPRFEIRAAMHPHIQEQVRGGSKFRGSRHVARDF